MDNRDIRESDFITLEEAAVLTGKSVHTLRKAVKTRPIRYHADVRNGRRVLVMSRLDLLKYYNSVDQMVDKLNDKSSTSSQSFANVEILMESVSFLKDQLVVKDEQLRAKQQQFLDMGEQIRRKDEQIKHLHIMMRHFQKNHSDETQTTIDRKIDIEPGSAGKF